MELKTAFTKDFDHDLTDEEIRVRSDALAALIEEIDEVDAERKEATSKFTRRLKEMRARASSLAHAVATKTEQRPVLCSERVQLRNFAIETYRHDTGKVVDIRSMNEEQIEESRQTGLFAGLGGQSGGPRVATEESGAKLPLSTPPPEEADAIDPPTRTVDTPEAEPSPEAAITNPGGLLDGREAEAARKREKPARTVRRRAGLTVVDGDKKDGE